MACLFFISQSGLILITFNQQSNDLISPFCVYDISKSLLLHSRPVTVGKKKDWHLYGGKAGLIEERMVGGGRAISVSTAVLFYGL